MKLEHLIQGYNFNRIPAKIKEKTSETSGVITYSEGINAAYLIDPEEIVVDLELFINCLSKELELDKQIKHTIEVIKILQQSIMLLSNITQEEANIILDKLGLYNGNFKDKKQIQLFEFEYQVEVVDSILHFSIVEAIK